MEAKLAQFASLSQKDKAPAYTSLIPEIFAQQQATIPHDIHILVDTVVNQDTAGLVVARQVLSELVKALAEGAIADVELRKTVIEDTLQTVQSRIVSYEEQVYPDTSFTAVGSIIHCSTGKQPTIPISRYSGRGGRLEWRSPGPHGHISRVRAKVWGLVYTSA